MPRTRSLLLTLAVAFLVAAPCLHVFASADAPEPETPGLLRSVRVDAASGGAPIVVIEADGPLPLPEVGVVGGPPRIYLDFRGIAPATRGTRAQPDALVRGVRVARYQMEPAITRVVIDLAQPVSHALDAQQREAGQVRVMLSLTAPGASRPGTTVPPPAPAKSQAAADRDRPTLLAAVSQLEQIRPVLSSIDSRQPTTEEPLHVAAMQLDAIRQLLATRSSNPLKERLITVCMLGKTAITLRLESGIAADPARGSNAASAAAGALILLDRAAAELKATPVQESR